jgi:hypothetical protein
MLSRQEEQADRLEVLENDKRVKGSTFSQFAESDATPLGRFSAISNPTIIGATKVPNYPAGPAWCAGDQGLEPPTGVNINEHPPVGEPHEIKASMQVALRPSLPCSVGATPSASDTPKLLAQRVLFLLVRFLGGRDDLRKHR